MICLIWISSVDYIKKNRRSIKTNHSICLFVFLILWKTIIFFNCSLFCNYIDSLDLFCCSLFTRMRCLWIIVSQALSFGQLSYKCVQEPHYSFHILTPHYFHNPESIIQFVVIKKGLGDLMHRTKHLLLFHDQSFLRNSILGVWL